MKISIVCGNLRAGGAERVISILANKFVKLGIEVSIYTWYKTDIFYVFDHRVNIFQIPSESQSDFLVKQIYWFRKNILKFKPSVVLSFLAPFNILTVFSLIGVKVPVIVAERTDPNFVSPRFNGFWKIVRNIAYLLSNGVLVQTYMNKNHFPRYIQRKSTVIYNPVTFSPEQIGSALCANKKREIVSITRLEFMKNVDMLIEAFKIFHTSYPDYTMTIYGEGQHRTKLEDIIRKLHLENSVFLAGRKQNVHELILSSSIFAMASNFEGMSNSLIEAMCLGLPCVSTKVSGATDLIQNGKNGYLVEIGNTEEMANALLKLASDENLRYSFGFEAAKLFDDLNIDTIAEQWLEYINRYVVCK